MTSAAAATAANNALNLQQYSMSIKSKERARSVIARKLPGNQETKLAILSANLVPMVTCPCCHDSKPFVLLCLGVVVDKLRNCGHDEWAERIESGI